MIYDKIENFNFYSNLGKDVFAKISNALADINRNTSCGKVVIDGDNIFCNIVEADLRATVDSQLEDHIEYADLHLILENTERMGLAGTEGLKQTKDYGDDIALFQCPDSKMNFIDLEPGTFLLLLPGEGHMPLLFPENKQCKKVKKAIFKIKADLFE